MRLKDIIKNIKMWSKPSLKEHFKNFWPSPGMSDDSALSLIIDGINHYLNDIFLSKNEGAFWLKTTDDELRDLRKRIERIEEENEARRDMDIELSSYPDDPGICGLISHSNWLPPPSGKSLNLLTK